MSLVPAQPKLYHIVHVDRLASIVADGCRWCDGEIARPLVEIRSNWYYGLKRQTMNELIDDNLPRMTAGRAALVGLMDRYLRGLLDPFVTLLEVHKLMYFMQEAGEPLRLNYEKAAYGPYAANLRHVLHAIEGHLVVGYDDGGDAPDKQLSLVPGAVEDAGAFLGQHPDTRARFERVTALTEGFESPFGLEMLSTVHWVMTKEGVSAMDDVVERVYEWSPRKRQFTPRQIGIAADTLVKQGWIKHDPIETSSK